MSLTARVLALMLALAMACALIVVVPGRTLDQQLGRERSVSELYDVSGRAADVWLSVKSELTASLVTLSRAESVRNFLAQPSADRANLQRRQVDDLLRALSGAYAADARVELVSVTGRVLASEGSLRALAGEIWIDADTPQGAWLRALEPRMEWITLGGGEASDQDSAVAMRLVAGAKLVQLTGSGEATLGYLVVYVEPDALRSAQNSAADSGIRMAYQWRNNGTFLLPSADGVPVEVANALAQRGPTDEQAAVSLPSWLAVKRQADARLAVLAWRPQSASFGFGTLAARDATVIALVAVVLLIGLLLRTLYRYVVRPVLEINDAALEVADGNLEVAVEHGRKDEIGQLANSFNHMVGSLRENMNKVRDLSYTDTLTGLPNRRLFNDLLERELRTAHTSKNRQALMFLDLDEFKRVNDSFGHQAGDDLLIEVGHRLVECLNKAVAKDSEAASVQGANEQDNSKRVISRAAKLDQNSTGAVCSAGAVARLGGDEFLLLLSNISKPEEAAYMAESILQAFEKELVIGDESIFVSTSIGIALFPDDGLDMETLLQHADKAMYDAKSVGKKTYKFFAKAMGVSAADQLRVQSRLRAAIKEDALELHLHPMFKATDGAACQAEALMRWNDPKLGFVSPGTFIPVAESSGDITMLTEWAIFRVCEILGRWSSRLPPDYRISVNVSSIDVARTDVAGIVQRALDHHRVEPTTLVVELTETGLLSTGAKPERVLSALKDVGVAIALDDFGTGYSSLGYLHRFPIDELKLDQQFVRALGSSSGNDALVAAVSALAQGMKLETVAEGVESPAAIARLRELRYDILQGYLFTKPLEESRFVQEFSRDPLVHRWMHYWIDGGLGSDTEDASAAADDELIVLTESDDADS